MNNHFINWPTFDDDGTINQQWNHPASPTFYIIDHKGVIQHKWTGKVGGEAIDAAIEKLMDVAENDATNR